MYNSSNSIAKSPSVSKKAKKNEGVPLHLDFTERVDDSEYVHSFFSHLDWIFDHCHCSSDLGGFIIADSDEKNNSVIDVDADKAVDLSISAKEKNYEVSKEKYVFYIDIVKFGDSFWYPFDVTRTYSRDQSSSKKNTTFLEDFPTRYVVRFLSQCLYLLSFIA